MFVGRGNLQGPGKVECQRERATLKLSGGIPSIEGRCQVREGRKHLTLPSKFYLPILGTTVATALRIFENIEFTCDDKSII